MLKESLWYIIIIILTECTSYAQTLHQYYSVTDLKDLGTNTPT